MNAHTRHLRGALPLTGYRPSWRLFAGVVAFTFIATIVGVHSL